MTSTSETGHAKNVANFQDLMAFIIAYGETYNPSKNSLKLPQLNALATAAQATLVDYTTKNTNYNNQTNLRLAAFSDLKSLSTRLLNALQTTNASPQMVNDAKSFNRKLQGKRASKPTTPTNTITPSKPNTPTQKTISTSQLSYDQQIQHLAGLISILQSEPSYTPNETDLTIATLTAKQANLTNLNNAVATAYTSISNSRISRNNTLYSPNTGLVDTALEVKKYIKSVFGATSPQFDQVNTIEFKKSK